MHQTHNPAHTQGEGIIQIQPRGQESWGHLRFLPTAWIINPDETDNVRLILLNHHITFLLK